MKTALTLIAILAATAGTGCRKEGEPAFDINDPTGEKAKEAAAVAAAAKANQRTEPKPVLQEKNPDAVKKEDAPKKPTSEELDDAAEKERMIKAEVELALLPFGQRELIQSARKKLSKDVKAELTPPESEAFIRNTLFFSREMVFARLVHYGELGGGKKLVELLQLKEAETVNKFLATFGIERDQDLFRGSIRRQDAVRLAIEEAVKNGLDFVNDDYKALLRPYKKFLGATVKQ